MIFQPTNVTPDEVNGSGTVDVTKGLDISWQVNGNSAMTAYQIDIYANDANSTLKHSTGRIALAAPFWGTNYKGDTQYYTANISAAALSGAGISNGNEYKFTITQWWSENDSVTQTTEALFLARSTPTVTINAIPSPLTERTYSFTAAYAQAQGDALKWVRWQIAEKNNRDEPFVDTGEITGTGQLRVDYDGFFTGTTYSVSCTIETSNGVQATSGWVDFTVSYAVGEPTGVVSACQLAGDTCILVTWGQMEAATGYSVYRRLVGESVLSHLGDFNATTGAMRDYSVRSGSSYVYYVFPKGELVFLTEPMVSEVTEVHYWYWTILEAAEGGNGYYNIVAKYMFRYGYGGVSEGSFTNNNAPTIQKNFTPYPNRQSDSANYLTGSVSGFIGGIDRATHAYSDTVEQAQKLRNLSKTKNALFLIDPKGNFLRIETSGAIQTTIAHKSYVMPQTVSIPWVEVGSTDGVYIVAAPGGDFYPTDNVIYTTLKIKPETGALAWTVPDDYDNGSILSLDANGKLIQSASGAFTAAEMALDGATGKVTATI